MTVPYGRYRGRPFGEVPRGLLVWYVSDTRPTGPPKAQMLHGAVAELRRRPDEIVPDKRLDALRGQLADADWWKKRTDEELAKARAQLAEARDTGLADVIRSAPRKAARLFHADRGGSNDAMRAVNFISEEIFKAR
jgi:hypothetical protein